jgi:hypothetical protein
MFAGTQVEKNITKHTVYTLGCNKSEFFNAAFESVEKIGKSNKKFFEVKVKKICHFHHLVLCENVLGPLIFSVQYLLERIRNKRKILSFYIHVIIYGEIF